MRSNSAFLIAVGASLCIPGRALAATEVEGDAEAGVRIESTTCSHALVDEVQHLARVELSNARLPKGSEAPRVTLSCVGRTILIRAALPGAGDTRQLDLDTTDEALRARVIAIAIAELVRETVRAPAAPPPVAPAPVSAPPAPAVAPPVSPPVTPEPAASNRLVLFGKVGNFGADFEPLYGGGFGFAHDLGRFALGVSPSIATSRREVAVGSVRTLAAELSLKLAFRFPSSVSPGEVGIGHALGVARISGTSREADVEAAHVSGVWAGPFVFAGIEPKLGSALFMQLSAQVGVVTVPVRAQVARASDTAITGLFAGLSLGLGLNL